MTKRLHFTLDEVLDKVAHDDEDLDDFDEPIMEGSDDEFSDLDVKTLMMTMKWTMLPPALTLSQAHPHFLTLSSTLKVC